MASDVADIHDIDLEVYGTKIDDLTATTTSTITSYNFEVCRVTWYGQFLLQISNTVHRDSSRMSYEDSKKWVFPSKYPPQILMVCM